MYICSFLHVIGIFQVSEHIPTEEHAINPDYDTVDGYDHLSNNPVKEPITPYAELTIRREVKATPHPAHVVT